MPEAILGVSAFYHDSAAAILVDGEVIAAAHEERFTRKKHDPSFPSHAIEYVLKEAGLELQDLSAIAFYDKPYLKFERLLETYRAFAPKGLKSFLSAIPVWIKEKLFMKKMLREETVTQQLAEENVIGWFQGRMEYGPRALGARSILGDARSPEMQRKMNLKIKYRESFRPFAPSVLEEDIQEYFDLDSPSPYMLLVRPVRAFRHNSEPAGYFELPLKERLYHKRSDIPAVTHIDYSARIQSVDGKHTPRYWKLLKAFKKLTGYGLLVNTSFNVRGEPIVCTPDDAFRCFMRTEMDVLVMGNYLFDKKAQPAWSEDRSKKNEDC